MISKVGAANGKKEPAGHVRGRHGVPVDAVGEPDPGGLADRVEAPANLFSAANEESKHCNDDKEGP